MDEEHNDPKGYRVPILHLADVVPTKRESSETSKRSKVSDDETEESTSADEAQQMLEDFIVETEKELQERKKTRVAEHAKSAISVQKETEILPQDVSINVAQEEEEEEANEKEAVATEKKKEETRFEKLVSAAAEKLDPLKETLVKPKRIEVTEYQETDHGEISQIFDSYLLSRKEEEKPKEEEKEDTIDFAPPLPDLPDIWEQDARTPKKTVFQKRTFKNFANAVQEGEVKNVPEKEETSEKKLSEPLQRIISSSKIILPTKPELSKIEPQEKKPEIQEVAQVATTTVLTKEVVQEKVKTPNIVGTQEEIEPTKTILERQDVSEAEQVILKKEGNDSSNLSSLRERIQKEHINGAVEQEVSNDIKEKTPLETKILDKEHIALSNTISQKIGILTTSSPDNNPYETRARPQSKHAHALSEIADRLHHISVGNENNFTFDNVPKSETKEVAVEIPQETLREQEATTEALQKPEPLAPGEMREPLPAPLPSNSVSPIRTFRQDVERAVTKNKTSIVNVIASEESRRNAITTIRTAPKSRVSSLSSVFIGASLLLFLGTLVVGGFLLYDVRFSNKKESTSITALFNASVPYLISNQSREELILGLTQTKDATHNSLGSIIEIELLAEYSDDLSANSKNRVIPSVFLEKIAPNAPGTLVRSAKDSIILAIHEMSSNQAFLLFTVDHRNTAFSGMFEWEENMNKDLSPLFGPVVTKKSINQTQNTSSNNASSSVVGSSAYTDKPQFEDLIISNKEVRGLRNQKGEVVLLWSMPDENHVVIATSETTMRVVLDKLTIYTQW